MAETLSLSEVVDPPQEAVMVGTRADSEKAVELANRAQATELAKEPNEVWFNKFIKDAPELDDELTNYDVWMFNFQDVCSKQNCSNVFLAAFIETDKLDINNSKNINTLMTHTMNERIRPFILQEDDFSTYICLEAYMPKGNELRVEILDSVQSIGFTDTKLYVQGMRSIQSRLIQIDPKREHPDTKALAYMRRLLDNVSDEQKRELFWLRDQWRPREEETDLNSFQVGKNMQEYFPDPGSEYAQVVYGKTGGAPGTEALKRGPPAEKTPCGIPHSSDSSHPWAECFSNPINAKKSEYWAANKNRSSGGKRGGGASANATILEVRLKVAEALIKVYVSNKKTKTAASSKAEIDSIMAADNNNADEKEDALIELTQPLSTMPVNFVGSSSCFYVATAFTVDKNNDPILYSGTNTTFVTS